MVFSLNNGPGVLYTALSVFHSRSIDMYRVESRPLRLSPLVVGLSERQQFNYLFYVDCLASVQLPEMKFALMDLADLAPQRRVLGSYRSYVVKGSYEGDGGDGGSEGSEGDEGSGRN